MAPQNKTINTAGCGILYCRAGWRSRDEENMVQDFPARGLPDPPACGLRAEI
jgi:hypothetical protein